MTKSVANVVIATDTFEGWVVKTNILLDALSNEIVTVSANATGSISTGNAVINGIMQIVEVATDGIRGGTVGESNTLIITSNVVTEGVSTLNSNVVVNAVSNVFVTSTSTTLRGGQVTITSNTLINAANVELNTSGKMRLSAGDGFQIDGNIGDVTAEVIQAAALVGIGQGFSVMNIYTSNNLFTVPENVTKLRYVVTGGGAGGGGAPRSGNNSYFYQSGGGAAGGTAYGVLDVTPGEILDIRIGQGGIGGQGNSATNGGLVTTSATSGTNSSIQFANAMIIIGDGGSNGSNSDNVNRAGGNPASGGSASGGQVNITGGAGKGGLPRWQVWTSMHASADGGASIFGPGAVQPAVSAASPNIGRPGSNATNFGTGGSGAIGGTSVGVVGGNGQQGVVIIEY